MLLISFLLLAQVENDAKRYHDAYVLEVIEGKTAEAAKAYLALMEDADASKRLRLQAEFRFAVCSALLGRADEGRARLARLAADPALPDDLKPQVDEYRTALAKVGMGTALDAKLQDLTMKLAGVPSILSAPAVYREFAVLGQRAVPYVKSMLSHPDADIRRHAWRILLQMRVPGLVSLWDPRMRAVEEFAPYLAARPERLVEFEARLRDLGAEKAAEIVLHYEAAGPYSEEFCVWLVDSGAKWGALLGMRLLSLRPRTQETEALVLKWLKDGTPEQQHAAARYYGDWATDEGSMRRPADLFEKYVDLCIPSNPPGRGAYVYACAVPLNMRFDALERTLAAARGKRPNDAWGILFGTLADDLARSIEQDAKTPAEFERYRGLLEGWVAAIDRRDAWGKAPKDHGLENHLRWIVLRSQVAAVTPIVEAMAEDPAAWRFLPAVLGYERPDDAALLKTAIERIAKRDRNYARSMLFDSVQSTRKPMAGYLEAVAPIWPMFVDTDASNFPEFALRIDRAVARRVLLSMQQEVEKRGGDLWASVLWHNFPNADEFKSRPALLPFAYEVALPTLDETWKRAPALQRASLLNFAIAMTCFGDVPEASQRDARAFIAARLDELPDAQVPSVDWKNVVNHPERLAPELWIPRIQPPFWIRIRNRTPLAPEFQAAAVRGFIGKPGLLNDNALQFLVRIAPAPEVARLAKALYPTADESLLALFVRNKLPCPVEIREKRLLDYLADSREHDPRLVLDLAASVLADQPSPRLIPAVEWLLARKERDVLLGAIDLADSLGSEKLIEKILPLLDSLDRNIRERAKRTIDSILENRRIREEVSENMEARPGSVK